MLTEVEGIVISETNYQETSKIINILTAGGIVSAIVKGAKSLKSPLRVPTMNLSYSRFWLYYKENKLSTIKEADIINDFKNIKNDIILISYMSYLCDLSKQVFKQNSNPKIYNLLISSLLKINDGLDPGIITNIYETKMLDYLGVGLVFDSCCLCGSKTDIITISANEGGYICKKCYTNQIIYNSKTLKMLRMYYLVDINTISKLEISAEVKNNIDYFLKTYYDRYTGLYLKSKKFLEKIKG